MAQPARTKTVYYAELEQRALIAQGYDETEARALVKVFSAGENPDGRFVFHFTRVEAAEKILKMGFRRGRYGYSGPGVYAGTTPTPGFLLKHVVWGLSNAPVRIPIDTQEHPGFRRTLWPLRTEFCKLKIGQRLVLGSGVR